MILSDPVSFAGSPPHGEPQISHYSKKNERSAHHQEHRGTEDGDASKGRENSLKFNIQSISFVVFASSNFCNHQLICGAIIDYR